MMANHEMHPITSYSVGPDDLGQLYSKVPYEWVVYWYEIEHFEGSGEAYAKNRDCDLVDYFGLSHCSCYEATDDMEKGNTCAKFTIDQVLKDKESIMDDDARPEIKAKIRELISKDTA